MSEKISSPNPCPPESKSILPGGIVGVLGGGQLGRMLAIAARRMGYRVHAYEPKPDSPAGQICDVEINAPYTSTEELEKFALGVDVISFEFENIPVPAIEHLAALRPVRPRGEVLHICQNREREKLFLQANGIPCAPFRVVDSASSLAAALAEIGVPCVLKTADFGYDGKGQIKLTGGEHPATVWEKFGAPRGVLEKWIPFQAELSVISARGLDGEIVSFPVSENQHVHHILDLSIVPGRFSPAVLEEAASLAERIISALDVVGLLAVEMFLTPDGTLLVNELAPRPHNSGHFTFDACETSQFEQQLRAVCGLPLGSPELLKPVVMWNLLGDLWSNGTPDWTKVLEDPRAKLHLYGKAEARPGRKMGHVCVMADTVEDALAAIEALKKKLL
ncbi:MAG: 5-(carboxyamino)imidazole ribonucleotide synthase [Terrimicrobiaceae bacterium]